MRLCDVDSNGNCDSQTYALSVARFGYGGAACAVVTFVVFLVFIPGRCCCNSFGGKTPSYGICCPNDWDSREYFRNEILSNKIAAFVVCIPIIIAVAIGFEANSDISSSVNMVANSLVDSGDNIVSMLEEVQVILLSYPITASSAPTINNTLQTAQTVDQNMHDAHDLVSKYDGYRQVVMVVAFAFTIALVIAGVIAAIFNVRVLAFAAGMVGLLVLTLVWISFGAHLVATKIVYDVCVDVKLLTTNSSSSSLLNDGALANLWDCGKNSDFITLQSLITNATNAAASQLCNTRAEICYNATSGSGDVHWVCSSSPACTGATLTTVTDPQHMTIIDGTQNRSLSDCAQNCANTTYKNISQGMELAVTQYVNFTAIYNETVLPLVTCQLADEVISDFEDPLCTTLFNSLYGVAVSNIIVGIFYVAFVVIMVVGYKRFTNLNEGVV